MRACLRVYILPLELQSCLFFKLLSLDNHRSLPLQVNQFFPTKTGSTDTTIEDLFATNGYMLDVIIKNTLKVSELKDDTNRSTSLIVALVGRMTKSSQQLHAIIDCGAILAGTNLREFSQSLLQYFKDDSFGGILYYDDIDLHDWVILEKSGRCLPKDISPVRDEDAFVIFDEPRCRGTDLKLRTEAVALLTLAPNM